jgi:hypothetical protein
MFIGSRLEILDLARTKWRLDSQFATFPRAAPGIDSLQWGVAEDRAAKGAINGQQSDKPVLRTAHFLRRASRPG